MTVDARIRELEGSGPLRYGAWVHRTTNQSITNGTITPITWSAAVEDAFGIWAGASTTSRLRIPIGGAGLYLIDLAVQWDTGAVVTNPQINAYVYDETNTKVTLSHSRGNSLQVGASASELSHEFFMVALSELWEVECWVFHNDAVPRNIVGGSDANSGTLPRCKLYRITR